jgi:hypothetical protein
MTPPLDMPLVSDWSKLGFSNIEYDYDKPTTLARW